jgi:hypothetical protein
MNRREALIFAAAFLGLILYIVIVGLLATRLHFLP